LFTPILAVALALSPTAAVNWLSFEGRVEVGALNGYTSYLGNYSGVDGGGSAELGIFLGRPLVDDGAPLTLQPFLQRTARVYLYAGGGGYSRDGDAVVERGRNGRASISIEGYPHPNLYLAANLGLRYDRAEVEPDRFGMFYRQTVGQWRIPVSVTAGLRLGDALFGIQYRIAPSQYEILVPVSLGMKKPEFKVSNWRDLALFARAVVKNRLDLSASVEMVEQGAQATLNAGIFFGAQRLTSLELGINGGASGTCQTAGGFVGISHWISRRMGIGVGYQPNWNRCDSPSDGSPDQITEHIFSLRIFGRR
jgi:hypothetical protein